MRLHRLRLGMSVVSIAAALGCDGGRGSLGFGAVGRGGNVGAGGGGGGAGSSAPVGRRIDLLFMVDDSSEMELGQANLKASLASFMDLLEALPGGLPDLHIAVVTSDMGAGDGSSIQGCSVSGDDGVFRFQPGLGCASTGLDPSATFLVDSGGASPTTNFGAQDVTSVLQCIIPVGGTGCGFEHQLASVARALGADGAPPPPQNVGFLRPNAVLAIVLLTNEDDCSGPPGSALFNPTSSALASKYGPTENFLCNEWGHLCVSPTTGQLVQPSRLAPNNVATDMVTYSPVGGPDNCQSFEQSPVLTSVGSIANGIRALKVDPAKQIVIAALAGPSYEYTVTWRAAPTKDTGPWPQMHHSCGGEAAVTSFADPGVRIKQFVTQFANGSFDSFCQADYTGPLGALASKLSQLIAP